MMDEEQEAQSKATKFEEELIRNLPDDLAMEHIGLSLIMKRCVREGKDPVADDGIKTRWLTLQFNAEYVKASHLAMEKVYSDDLFSGYNEEEPDEPSPFGRN